MNMRLIRISKVAFDTLFWFGLIGLVIALVGAGFLPALADYAVENAESFSGTFLGAQVDVDISGLDTADAVQFGWGAFVGLAATLAVSVYVAQQIRRALRSVLDGSAFRDENYGRLRRIAYAIFAVVPFGIISQSWMDTVSHGSFQFSIDLQLGTIAIGLLALSIAEIYKAGISLQDEAELTV